jgi:hypothetical protein
MVPGVVQLRAKGIFAYARGQSAMVYYTCSGNQESMHEFMVRCSHRFLTHAEKHGACLIRFGETEQPDRELTRLLTDFERRFGSGPVANAASASS